MSNENCLTIMAEHLQNRKTMATMTGLSLLPPMHPDWMLWEI